MSRILITGGAGFIGSHLAHSLVQDGNQVRVLDNMDPQVHNEQSAPIPLPSEVQQIKGDLRDPQKLSRALEDVDAVYHFAAAVGVGQSMYEIQRYVDNNSTGTAALMQALSEKNLERLVVASSMSIYGEGLYEEPSARTVEDARRVPKDVQAGRFEVMDAAGNELAPVATPETKRPQLESVYALTKYDQERLCLMLGQSYNIPTTALRFFNVYGPGQTLGNPYTGVLSIFATRILNDNPPIVFEDGSQRRDFVHVDDVVQACRRALDAPEAAGQSINVGSGDSITIAGLAAKTLDVMDADHLEPDITNKARLGDVRHCFADIRRAQRILGYRPRVTLEEGLRGMMRWLEGQQAEDHSEAHVASLQEKGLIS